MNNSGLAHSKAASGPAESDSQHQQPRSPAMLSSPCSLDAPFAYNSTKQKPSRLLFDTYTSRPIPTVQSSPASSVSSEGADPAVSRRLAENMAAKPSSLAMFVATRSRVVTLYDLPAPADVFLSAVFAPQNAVQHALAPIPSPTSLWVERDAYGSRSSCVWAVFKTHEEARAALALSGAAMSVAPALESDLEPFSKLCRFDLKSPAPKSAPHSPSLRPGMLQQPVLHGSSSLSDLQTSARSSYLSAVSDYTLSSNPPNPRTNFRLGDWICPSPACAAHNFGRNLACIGCGAPRTSPAPATATFYQTTQLPARPMPSPRFVSAASNFGNTSPTSAASRTAPTSPLSPLYPSPQHSAGPHASSFPHQLATCPTQSRTPPTPGFSAAPKSAPLVPAHPLLTPSGRAFAIGGKVQNVSGDPLSPCIMYWPDNEPFPEQGQIRPPGLANNPHPPILNTGNRGPIAHQPGDWICKKCNYLNWRRRKVCQTCLPYAEGNGDSISAAVQAERIALLTSVLTQTTGLPGEASPTSNAQPQVSSMSNFGSASASSATPVGTARPNNSVVTTSSSSAGPNRFVSVTPPPRQAVEAFYASSASTFGSGATGIMNGPGLARLRSSVHRSQSHLELGAQYTGASSSSASSRQVHVEDDSAPILYETGGPRVQQPQSQQGQQFSAAPGSTIYQSGAPRTHAPSADAMHLHAPAPAPLLPSFLQSMVRSPTLSPASTSSADLSFEDDQVAGHGVTDDTEAPAQSPGTASNSSASSSSGVGAVGSGRPRQGSGGSPSGANRGSVGLAHLSNIWRMNGEETKQAQVQQQQQQLLAGFGGMRLGGAGLGGSRKSSLEQLQY